MYVHVYEYSQTERLPVCRLHTVIHTGYGVTGSNNNILGAYIDRRMADDIDVLQHIYHYEIHAIVLLSDCFHHRKVRDAKSSTPPSPSLSLTLPHSPYFLSMSPPPCHHLPLTHSLPCSLPLSLI